MHHFGSSNINNRKFAWQMQSHSTHTGGFDKACTPWTDRDDSVNDWHEQKHMCCGPLWPTHAEYPSSRFSAARCGVNSWKMPSDVGAISHGHKGSILVRQWIKRPCGLLNSSFLQCLDCVWEEAKGVKARGRDMCGDQVRVQQRVTVRHTDSWLFSPTWLEDSSQLPNAFVAGNQKS